VAHSGLEAYLADWHESLQQASSQQTCNKQPPAAQETLRPCTAGRSSLTHTASSDTGPWSLWS